jgi:4-amino-4-deoxy-L-arabinose transferase-like glycosyltransferase
MAWSVVAGLVVAAAYALSPLTVLAAVLAAVLFRFAGRGLPPAEQRWLAGLLLLALALRAAAVGVIFLAAPHDDQAVAVLSGDEAQMQARAMRMRDIVRGAGTDRFDYVVVFDEYGQNSYNAVLADAQVLFGPSPYGMRLLNSLCFAFAAVLLFHLARRAYGALPAFGGLAVLLFVPTLFVWSISLLKESLYFLLTVTTLVAALHAARRPGIRARVGALAVIAVALWSLRDLRPGAVAITLAGLGVGLGAGYLGTRPRRDRMVAGAACAVMATVALALPAVRSRAQTGLGAAAKTHAGHVFTVGHSYKLLDGGFYVHPRPLTENVRLTPGEAARFLIRAIVSFVTVPLPWQIVTGSELAFVPEQILWYMIVALAAVGARSAFQTDSMVAGALLGLACTTAAVVAVTNGNVGTLIRFRGLVTPYVIWISAVGFCVTIRRLASMSHGRRTGSALLRTSEGYAR